MNERQKKIMVPYQEPTDTCPDCSNHPCDCGLPAGYTPTPRTDEIEGNLIEFCDNPIRFPKMTEHSRQLEKELTAVTEQRDGLTKTCWALWFNELLRLASIKGITTSDDADCWWDDFNNGKTPQESMNEFLDSDEGLAFRDNCKQNDESSQLALVTEQRDRLADLVKQFIYILDITEESDSGRLFHPTNITSCRAGDLQKAGELVEALRRAVKGGADE